jgi:hypothetical protein
VTDQLLRGAYVELNDLLALRFRPLGESRLAATVVSARGGTRLSRQRGRGIDFSEVRLYQPGDDVRTIDWRVTARKNVPHTKVFREERERLTLIVVDQSQSMFFGSRVRLKSVAAAEFAGLAAWRAIRQNDRVGGVSFWASGSVVRVTRHSLDRSIPCDGSLPASCSPAPVRWGHSPPPQPIPRCGTTSWHRTRRSRSPPVRPPRPSRAALRSRC